MKSTGTKAELLMRLQNSGNSVIERPLKIIDNEIIINSINSNNINDNGGSDSNSNKIVHREMTVKALQILCREKNLKVSGKKQEIIDRLVQFELDSNVDNNVNKISNSIEMTVESSPSKNSEIGVENCNIEISEKSAMYNTYNNMDKKSLIDICMSKCLSSNGSKEQLIDTLMRDYMADEEVTEEAFVQCFNEGLRKETPLYTIQAPAKKYREIT